jgi:hypothetical protein
MTQFRIDVTKLAGEIDEVLAHAAAGEEVLIEREGEVVGEFHSPATARGGNFADFIRLRATKQPVDDEFQPDVEEAVAAGNTRTEPVNWD